MKALLRFLWIQIIVCACAYGFYQWRVYEHDQIEMHAVASDVRSLERLALEQALTQDVITNQANWNHDTGEAHLRIIEKILEKVIARMAEGVVLERLEREY